MVARVGFDLLPDTPHHRRNWANNLRGADASILRLVKNEFFIVFSLHTNKIVVYKFFLLFSFASPQLRGPKNIFS